MIRHLFFVAALAILAAAAHSSVWHVDADSGASNPNGGSWANAFTSIQDAVDAAVAAKGNGDHEIWVAGGTYPETVHMSDGIDMYGGFAGNETDRRDRDWVFNPVIVDGAGARQCIYGASAVLDGFIMYRGYRTASGNGAGLVNVNASPTVRNCAFIDNEGGFGAAVANTFSQPRFENCLFYGNVGRHGSVMYNTFSTATLVNCTATQNMLELTSGSIENQSSSVILLNCIFWANDDIEIDNAQGSQSNVAYSNIEMDDEEETYPGTGNINGDPLFFDPENGDFRLSPDSPCIDSGSSSGIIPPADYRGVDRGQGNGVDIGAYEFLPNDPTDTDGDGIPDNEEGLDDTDGDGIPNYLDADSDNDGIDDLIEGNGDADGDGIPNYLDSDSDGNGQPDIVEGDGDADGNGIPDFLDPDNDGDGIPDFVEGTLDMDGDTIPNMTDTDSDNDGMDDAVEGAGDPDGDGIPNFLDLDSDGDGISDHDEGFADDDNDGIPAYLDDADESPFIYEDVNGDGSIDAVDIQLVINAVLGS